MISRVWRQIRGELLHYFSMRQSGGADRDFAPAGVQLTMPQNPGCCKQLLISQEKIIP